METETPLPVPTFFSLFKKVYVKKNVTQEGVGTQGVAEKMWFV
jgi:hypothetical protein